MAASPVLLHYTLPVLMVYLVAGTVAQKYIGLYQATQIFFSAPIIWLGVLPLPGVPVILALIFINLAAKLAFKSPWTLRNAGNILTHIGAMLLLVGGLMTALFSAEGYIDLAKGDQKSVVADYHKRELVMTDSAGKPLWRMDQEALAKGATATAGNMTLSVLETCRHCKIVPRKNADNSYIGMAEHMQLEPAPLRLEDEENLAGMTFRVNGKAYTVLENVPNPAIIKAGDQTYSFILRREERDLPFRVELLEFSKEYYSGTTLASSYQSRVRIHDGKTVWESAIRMNEPLRYKGYTLYQASFIPTPQGDLSILSVVWNAGRIFPYLSGIVICLGLLLHMFVRRLQK